MTVDCCASCVTDPRRTSGDRPDVADERDARRLARWSRPPRRGRAHTRARRTVERRHRGEHERPEGRFATRARAGVVQLARTRGLARGREG